MVIHMANIQGSKKYLLNTKLSPIEYENYIKRELLDKKIKIKIRKICKGN